MPHRAIKIAAIKPTMTAIMPPLIPGPMYAYEGTGKQIRNRNKIVLSITSLWVP